LQCLGDMPWVSRATAMSPDKRYVAREDVNVNARDDCSITATLPVYVADMFIRPPTTGKLLPPTALASQETGLL